MPPGWDRWVGVCLWPGNYYNYTLSVDGAAEAHGDDYARDYLTDLIANRTLEFVAEQGKGGIENRMGGNVGSLQNLGHRTD